MKKLLMLLSLTLAVSAFGAPQGDSQQSADMKITARVIDPLTVVAEPMQFGDIIKGTTANADSTFTIKGEPSQGITLTIDGINELSNANGDKLAIVLKGFVNGTVKTTLANDGNLVKKIEGSLTPDLNTVSGEYSGTLTARVQYQ
ncbi:DUF4402 domain-containing protein [Cetobacterium sp.]|uniref:DUF4402 domain-containing protein n=1 Tax=Cetobacterium sp. TaxID=2071632 RepID=UPI003F395EE2